MKTNDVTRITVAGRGMDKGHGQTAPLYIWSGPVQCRVTELQTINSASDSYWFAGATARVEVYLSIQSTAPSYEDIPLSTLRSYGSFTSDSSGILRLGTVRRHIRMTPHRCERTFRTQFTL